MDMELYNKLFDTSQQSLIAVTSLSSDVKALCTKVDDLIANGSPRCAKHGEQIASLQRSQTRLIAWISGLTMSVVAAIVQYFKG